MSYCVMEIGEIDAPCKGAHGGAYAEREGPHVAMLNACQHRGVRIGGTGPHRLPRERVFRKPCRRITDHGHDASTHRTCGEIAAPSHLIDETSSL